MGYSIHIRRGDTDDDGMALDPISLAEWSEAVGRVEGVRMAEGDFEAPIGKTGKVLGIKNNGGDAEGWFPATASWARIFYWFEGAISFRATSDFVQEDGRTRMLARALAKELGARLVGEEEEIYD